MALRPHSVRRVLLTCALLAAPVAVLAQEVGDLNGPCLGQSCNSKSLRCIFDVCRRPSEEGGPCDFVGNPNTNDDCAAGLQCVSNRCIPDRCSETEVCPDGFNCGKDGICEPPESPTAAPSESESSSGKTTSSSSGDEATTPKSSTPPSTDETSTDKSPKDTSTSGGGSGGSDTWKIVVGAVVGPIVVGIVVILFDRWLSRRSRSRRAPAETDEADPDVENPGEPVREEPAPRAAEPTTNVTAGNISMEKALNSPVTDSGNASITTNVYLSPNFPNTAQPDPSRRVLGSSKEASL